MARVTGWVFGELKGKFGGLVASRNKYGAYIRALVTPVDPATVAQLAARSAFGNSSAQYHSLTPGQKAAWTGFGATAYQPAHPKSDAYSGFNAFVGMRNSVTNALRLLTIPVMTTVVGSTALTESFTSFTPTQTPPSGPLIGDIVGDDGNYTQSLGAVTFNATTKAFTAQILNDAPAGQNITNMEDSNGNPYGIGFYMSRAFTQEGMFVENPEETCLGVVPSAEFTGMSDDVSGGYNVAFTSSIDPNDKQNYPVFGQVVQITARLISSYGAYLPLGSSQATVAGTPPPPPPPIP